jgi:hypothetical protein
LPGGDRVRLDDASIGRDDLRIAPVGVVIAVGGSRIVGVGGGIAIASVSIRCESLDVEGVGIVIGIDGVRVASVGVRIERLELRIPVWAGICETGGCRIAVYYGLAGC